MNAWQCALELDNRRTVVDGSEAALCDAVRRGADLRIYTEFRHNEHIDVDSDDDQMVREVAEFPATYLVDDRWAAGIMTLRQPIDLPDGFGPRPSMSFFLYNQDGQQAIARPHLDAPPAAGAPGPSPVEVNPDMPKAHPIDAWDGQTNAPSNNFVYDFEVFRYWVRDDWTEVLAHGPRGNVTLGSVGDLAKAFSDGSEVKVGIRGLCGTLAVDGTPAIDHEVFIRINSCYYYTGSGLFIGATHPLVRVRPDIPLRYGTEGWDFGWGLVRTDGHSALLTYDPYTLRHRRSSANLGVRWFVR